MGKKVLILTYYWPPSGGPAVQRWLTFSNQFHELGFEPFIITVDENSATYPMKDESLVKEVHPKTVVQKTITKEWFWIYKKYFGRGTVPSAGFVNDHKPGPIKLFARFIRGNFFIPDGRKSWNKILIPAAIELIKKEKIDIIISAGPPHSTHLAALEIKKEFPKIFWVADFHDAWTDIWFYKKLLHTKLAASIDKKLELSVLKNADRVLTVGQQLLDKLALKLQKKTKDNNSKDKFRLISMGYDEELFQQFHLKKKEGVLKEFSLPTILYTGTINSEYEPWGFFKALEEVKNTHPNQPFSLKLVGKVEEGLINYLNDSNLKNNYELVDYVPHHQAVEMMFQARILFICSPKTESEDIIIPGKVYEYMASGTPILNLGALTTNTSQIIASTNSGKNFEREDVHSMATYIAEHLYSEANTNPYFGDISKIQSYSRKVEAKRILEGI